MAKLYQTYWHLLYGYIRRRGYAVADAQDLTQDFFVRLLKNNGLTGVDQTKGNLRSFLFGALDHFLANEWRRSRAAKRGGGQRLISLDAAVETRCAVEPSSDLTPEKLFERRWALSLFERALGRLQKEYSATGKAAQYDSLKQFLVREASDGEYS